MTTPGALTNPQTTRKIAIHVWHLEMTSRPVIDTSARRGYDLKQAQHPLPELNRFLYAATGAPWSWYQRLEWSWQDWRDYLGQDGVQTWVAYLEATPVGYFELERQHNGVAEIVYFGLLTEFIGRGFGRQLLEDAIAKAWELATSRIWLHTCSLDHPGALPNYLKRGFRVFREEDFTGEIPVSILQPWEGANKPAPRPQDFTNSG